MLPVGRFKCQIVKGAIDLDIFLVGSFQRHFLIISLREPMLWYSFWVQVQGHALLLWQNAWHSVFFSFSTSKNWCVFYFFQLSGAIYHFSKKRAFHFSCWILHTSDWAIIFAYIIKCVCLSSQEPFCRKKAANLVSFTSLCLNSQN